jgi:hypothetical protein
LIRKPNATLRWRLTNQKEKEDNAFKRQGAKSLMRWNLKKKVLNNKEVTVSKDNSR